MTNQEISAMRQVMIENRYPIEKYIASQPDYKEQIAYHYILFLLYEAEYSGRMDDEVRRLYDILYAI